MSRYILDINSDIAKSIVVFGMVGERGISTVFKIDELEELNSDYINEHFGELQDDAYKRGLEDGKKAFDLLDAERDSEYRRGLSEGNDIGYKNGVKDGQNEAWECAKKLFSTMSETEIEKVFPTEWENGFYGLMQMKPQYAIAKLKAYEEKESEEIKVGDIIANNTEPKLKVWVTYFDEIGFCGIAITDFGIVDKGELYASCSPKGWHKIGRFDINKILEGLRYDN